MWKEGFPLDVHTLSSDYLGDDEFGHAIFRTTRTELGELLYRLKYQRDTSAVDGIVDAAFAFVRSWNPGADVFVPVPPTRATRPHQPVSTLATALGARLGLPVHSDCVRLRKEIPELKDVFDFEARLRLLELAHEVDPKAEGGRRTESVVVRRLVSVRSHDERHHEGPPCGWRRGSVCPGDYPLAEQEMSKMFIGGSRRITRLPSVARQRIDRMIAQKLPIVIGDANGADKAVQAYLADRRYGAVEVFCVRGKCRNNLGGWRVREVAAPHSRRDFAFYASKDEEMAKDADVGFMIWDGKSFGTLANAFRLIDEGKKVVVFVSSDETFVTTLRSRGDWNRFVSDCAPSGPKHAQPQCT